MQIDLQKCRKGMEQLNIEGRARPELIEEAIRLIQQSSVDAMSRRYLGIKNYASFGDQREDHDYGYGPKHGSIVFSIGRTDAWRVKPLTADAIYLLEAYRDFEPVLVDGREDRNRKETLYLCGAIRLFDRLSAERNRLADAFNRVDVDEHIGAVQTER